MPEQVIESNATIRWLTHPPQGTPRLTVGSRTFSAVPMAIDRAAAHPLETSPGELMAGAYGSAFAWLLAEKLMSINAQAQELVVDVGLTAQDVPTDDLPEPTLTGIHISAEVRLPGLEQEQLQAVSESVCARTRRVLGLRDDLTVHVETTVVGG